MGLSSNILWHQTNKDNLKKILKQKCFRYSYSLESIKYEISEFKMAFPMLSLCDIPIADILEYISRYGGNSIGLSREWGIKNGITPVFYCEKSSSLLEELISLFLNNRDEEIKKFFWRLISHVKNYDGALPKYQYRKYRFYDEREVRIVPKIEQLQELGYETRLTEEEYHKYKSENKNSLLSADLNISFDYSDIRYFILKDDRSIAEIKKNLSKEINLNESKICFFTISQIKEDFIGQNHNELIEGTI